MIDISVTLATIKAVAGVAKEAGKIELYQQIIDLQQAILEALSENARLISVNATLTLENAGLRQRLGELEASAKQLASVVIRDGTYWTGDGISEAHGPFCARCYEVERRLVRMRDDQEGLLRCIACNHWSQVPGFYAPLADDDEFSRDESGMPTDW